MAENNKSIEGYDLPEEESVILDLEKEKVVDKENISPWEMIELTAKQNKIKIRPPKEDCRKSGCYGRGYVGWEKGIPVPCVCIFAKEDRGNANQATSNRAQVRHMHKIVRREINNKKQLLAKRLGLVCVNGDTFKNKNGNLFVWDRNKNDFNSKKKQ